MDKRTGTLFGLLLAAFIILILWKSCDRAPIVQSPLAQIKKDIQADKVKKDSVKKEVDTVTIIQTKYITKWKTIRHDSLIPCEEKLILCDTIIYIDSTLISELRQVIKIDSSLIVNQDKVIRADSLTIIDLKKDNRKQKRRKNIAIALAGIVAGISLIR